MFDTILCRYGELALKGGNRWMFERRLVDNIKDCLNKNKVNFKIRKVRGRIIINSKDECFCLKNVFGLVSFSRAIETELDMDKIKENCSRVYTKGSFRISTHRVTKNFLSSKEINENAGGLIIENKKAKVKLKDPDLDIGVEIIQDKSYVFNEKIKCLGGLPVGAAGLVSLLLQNKKSLEAGYLMLKRGCCLEVIGKLNYNYLKKYSHGCEIKKVDKPSIKSRALIVNDNLDNIRDYKTDLVVLRPLLGK